MASEANAESRGSPILGCVYSRPTAVWLTERWPPDWAGVAEKQRIWFRTAMRRAISIKDDELNMICFFLQSDVNVVFFFLQVKKSKTIKRKQKKPFNGGKRKKETVFKTFSSFLKIFQRVRGKRGQCTSFKSSR